MYNPYPPQPAGAGNPIARACAQPHPAGWSQQRLAFVQSTVAAQVLQYVVLLLAFLYTAGASAQITSGFELDGNAVKTTSVDDWDRIKNNTSSASVTTGIITDAAIPTDNIFLGGGSKDDLDISGWKWTGGSTTDKGDLLHGGAALYGDKLYFFGDRFATDGTASIGFWLLQNQISLNPNGNFNGTHKVGDLLILSEFTNGGAVANIKAYKWVGGGSPLQELSVTGTDLFAIVNSALIDSPWPYQAKDGSVAPNKIAPGGFFEGGIDLAAVQASIDPCFTTFLIRTRVSQQSNATLDDFLLGSFFTKPKVTVNSGQKCDDGSGFTVTATVQGGVGPLSYDWTVPAGATDPGNVATFQATVTGTYSVVVTGANGCASDPASGSVTLKPALGLTLNKTNVNCNAANDGTITAVASGGSAPYTYVLTLNNVTIATNTTGVFTNLADGTYTVEVSAANSCNNSESISITEPPVLSLSASVVNVLCNGAATGSIDLSVNGGTAPYTYAWSNGATSQDLSNLENGTYTVTVTDAKGCEKTLSKTVNEPAVLSLSATVTDVLCNGASTGSINLSVSGGNDPYTYLWSNGATSQDISGLQNGTYTVTVTDANGCEKTLSKTVNEPAVLSLSATVTDVLCNGASTGSINLSVSGGNDPYTYLWSNGATSQDISGLQNGTYTVTVTDANGCEKTLSKTINEPAALSLSATVTDVLCNGASTGSINLSVSGGNDPYTYLWSNGATSQDISGLQNGTYTVTVTDANGCEKTLSKTVNEPAALSLSGAVTNVLCNGAATGSINLSVSGGNDPYTYDWSNGATTQDISGLTAGSYTVTVTDANGCEKTLTKTVTEPAVLSLSATVTDVLCNGASTGSINLSVSGGNDPYTYLWSNGATTQDISGLQNGTYTVTVTDANGCEKTLSKTVNEPAVLSLSATVTDVLCNGASTGSINLSVSGGNDPYTYDWSNGATTQDISGLTAGTYTVTVTDANGCEKTLTKTINQPAALSLSATVTDVLCNGASTGSINLSVSGGNDPYTYEWSNGATSQDISGLTAGTYTVTVTDANGCEKTLSKTINQPAVLSLSATVTDVLCNGASTGSINLSVSGGNDPYTYLWSNGATTQDISGLQNGTYTVTVTDANGCEKTLSKTVNEPAVLSLSATATQVLCNGASTGSINLSVSGGNDPYTYEWSNGATTQDISGLTAGTYTVTVTDANGCEKTLSKTITQPPAIVLSATQVNVKCNGAATGSINLSVSGGNDPYTYLWSNGATSQDISGLTAGTYSVKVTDANGCEKTLSKTITQPAKLVVSCVLKSNETNCANNGSLSASVMGGVSPYTYEWKDSQGAVVSINQTATGLGAGSYTVTVKDANYCTASSTCQVKTTGFRTQTQGGWGTLPSGSNPGAYMRQTVTVGGVTKTRFAHAFPNGVVVGDIYTDNCYKYTLKLTSPAAVSAFLPSGGTARALTQSLTNPTRESYSNVFAGQVVALTLSVGFDNKFSDFGSSTTLLKNLFVLSGPFKGKTVGQVLAEANKKLGGCASVYTFTQLNDAVSSINENFVDGQTKGSFLGCDNPNAVVASSGREAAESEAATEVALEPIRLSAFPNPAYGVATIEFTVAKTGPAALEVYNTRGDKVKTLFNGVAEGGKAYQVTLQTDDRIVPGAYIYRVQAGSEAKSSRLIMIKQ